jgi:membrane protein required for colicin V production
MNWIIANWLDVILLLFMAGFVFYGLFYGFIKTIGSLAGVVIGAWGAGLLYLPLFAFAKNLSFGHEDWGKTISFIICFVVIDRIICLVFALLDRAFHFVSIVPFLKTINRLGGAALGFIEGGLVLGLLIFVAGRYAIIGSWLGALLAKSQLAPFLIQFANVLKPLLPELLKQLKSVI